MCGGTRASLMLPTDKPVELHWTAPAGEPGGGGGGGGGAAVLLRVAAAVSMGNLTTNAFVLNASAPGSGGGFFCTTSQGGSSQHGFNGPNSSLVRQCQSVPKGTKGGLTLLGCEAECFRAPPPSTKQTTAFECSRCAHAYDSASDGHGLAFEDLPEGWTCPVCGAPKSAYAKVETAGGGHRWVHS